MEFSNFYTIETLQYLNDSHDYGYPVDQSDTDKVNRLIAGIQRERDGHDKPVPGDIIEYTSRNGDYFNHAHIGHTQDDHLEICLSENIPFCYDSGKGTGYDMQEGVWTHPKKIVPEPAGIRIRLFKTWGHAGRCAHGSVYFKTFVRSWKYAEPGPLFGKYTTKDWTKYFICKLPDPERKGEFTYKGDGFHPLQPVRTGQAGRDTPRRAVQWHIPQFTRPMGLPHGMGTAHGTGMERNGGRNTYLLPRRFLRKNPDLPRHPYSNHL